MPLLLQRIGINLELASGLTVALISMVLPLVIQQQLVSSNLTWLRSVPYSKTEIVSLNFVLGLFSYFMIALAALIGMFILFMIERSELVKLDPKLSGSSFQVAVGLFREIFFPEMKNSPDGNYIESIVLWVGVIVVLLSLLFGVGQRLPQAQKFVDTKQQQKILIKVYVALAVLFLFFQMVLYPIRHYWATAFVLYSAVIVFFIIFNTERTLKALAFPRIKVRRWFVVSSSLSCALVAFFWLLAQHELHSDSSISRSQGVLFLGGLSGKLSEKSLAEVLNTDLDSESVVKISKVYRDSYTNDELLRVNPNVALSFDGMIASKKKTADLSAVLDQWNISTLDQAGVRAFYKKADELRIGYLHNAYDLLAAKITKDELKQMIVVENHQGDTNLLKYALLRAKYYREPEYVEVILNQFPQYSDNVKSHALGTLSALVGEKNDLEKYIGYRMGKQLNKKFYNPDCSLLDSKNSERVIQDLGDASLNICLRDKVFRSHDIGRMITFDNMGWLSKPLRPDQVGV